MQKIAKTFSAQQLQLLNEFRVEKLAQRCRENSATFKSLVNANSNSRWICINALRRGREDSCSECRNNNSGSSMTTAADFDKKYDIIDAPTPPNTLMSGHYKQSFAYKTMRDRLPVTLTSIIDNLARDKDELAAEYGEDAREEVKTVVGHLSKLKYQLQTDKPLEPFTGNEPDTELWNNFLRNLPADHATYFRACWLYAECYLYRRVSSHFKATEIIKDFDYFHKQKANAMEISANAMEQVVKCTRNVEKSESMLMHLLKLNLWGNRCDLSITSGREVKLTGNPFDHVDDLDKSLLIDQTQAIWNCISQPDCAKSGFVVDFVCDNAGYEFFTDLILAEYIIDHGLAAKIRFNVKAIPWFISDVMPRDFHWSLKFLSEHPSAMLQEVGKKWTQFVESGKFELVPEEHFWTSPYEFFRMREINPTLYKNLASSHLIIFKGDLNYRKLIGDFTWDFTTDFITCLRGFQPSNLCTLRTIKADLVCGLPKGRAEQLFEADPNWMFTGEYGVIQFAEAASCSLASICFLAIRAQNVFMYFHQAREQ